MIGYVTLGTNDHAKARAFYDPLLALLGGALLARDLVRMPDEMGRFLAHGAVGVGKGGASINAATRVSLRARTYP
mgnify:CR=1 FL=1